MDRFAGFAVPYYSGFALVGYAYGFYVSAA
jgi:hypothetical protein